LPDIVVVVTSHEPSKTNLWHARLGHMSEHGLTELIKKELLVGCNMSKLKFCEHCIFVKHKRVKFNASVHTTKGILEYVHADLWGPSRKKSLGGSSYMLTITNDYSKKVWPYILKHKYEAFDDFWKWKVMIEKQTNKKVKLLHIDNGMKFCSNEFRDYYSDEGIVRHHTIPYTSPEWCG
jgi:hypothetical protein